MTERTVGQLNALMFGGDRYPVKALLGEVKELLTAVWRRQWNAAAEEASQVAFDVQHVLYGATGLDFKPRLCRRFVAELVHRAEVWSQIFSDKGLEFDPRWLRGGSNYRRPEKVKAALRAAGLDP